MSAPLAYFITFTTYGTWLHGRDPGSVDYKHNLPSTPFLPANQALERSRREAMQQKPYLLDEPRRQIVLQTLHEVATHRRWRLWAAHVRTNHVHIVLTAPSRTGTVDGPRARSVSEGQQPQSTIAAPKPPTPEKVMNDLKAWASRRLREAFNEPADRRRWTEHGSTRWLNTQTSLREAIRYVVEEQGDPMARFDGRHSDPKPYEPEA